MTGTPTFLLLKSHPKIHFCNIAYRKSRQLKHSYSTSTMCQAADFTVDCAAWSFTLPFWPHPTRLLPKCIKSSRGKFTNWEPVIALMSESAPCTSRYLQKRKHVQCYTYSTVHVCICGMHMYVMDKHEKNSLFFSSVKCSNHLLAHLNFLIKLIKTTLIRGGTYWLSIFWFCLKSHDSKPISSYPWKFWLNLTNSL